MAIKVVGIIQARMGSTRLPSKVLKDIEGKAMLERVVSRVKTASMLNEVVVATTIKEEDDAIVELCKGKGWLYYRGSEQDVLDRYYQAATKFKADVVVRITADCPLIDSGIIDEVVSEFLSLYPDIDYVSNVLPPRTYPRGLDTEAVNIKTLAEQWRTCALWREHVTLGIRNYPLRFRVNRISNGQDYSYMRWCVDTAEDLEFVRKVYGEFGDSMFSWYEVVRLLERHPEWMIKDTQVDQR